jgi:hypothetical protein
MPGALVTSTCSSFQNNRLAGEYGLGSNGSSRKAESIGSVASTPPPRSRSQRCMRSRSVNEPTPQSSCVRIACNGANTPHVGAGSPGARTGAAITVAVASRRPIRASRRW